MKWIHCITGFPSSPSQEEVGESMQRYHLFGDLMRRLESLAGLWQPWVMTVMIKWLSSAINHGPHGVSVDSNKRYGCFFTKMAISWGSWKPQLPRDKCKSAGGDAVPIWERLGGCGLMYGMGDRPWIFPELKHDTVCMFWPVKEHVW